MNDKSLVSCFIYLFSHAHSQQSMLEMTGGVAFSLFSRTSHMNALNVDRVYMYVSVFRIFSCILTYVYWKSFARLFCILYTMRLKPVNIFNMVRLIEFFPYKVTVLLHFSGYRCRRFVKKLLDCWCTFSRFSLSLIWFKFITIVRPA